MLYPVLRSADLVPTKAIANLATSISAERALSLDTRFVQESELLERASQRFFFGWGRWGRNRIFAEDDGRDVTKSDGDWIITVGKFGLFGFVARFGLLVLPVFRAAAALKSAVSLNERVYLAALALIVAVNVLDLLPNSTLTPWTWLLAGALLGRAEALGSITRQQNNLSSHPSLGPPPADVHGLGSPSR